MNSPPNFSPLIVTLLILSVIIAIILILILTISQNPNPVYSSSYSINTSIVNSPSVYSFGEGGNIALQDSTGAITRLNDLKLDAVPSTASYTCLTQLGINSLNGDLKTPYYLSGTTKYLNYFVAVYNQINGENIGVGVTTLVPNDTFSLVLLSDVPAVEYLLPTIESNLLQRNGTSFFYEFFNKTSTLNDGIRIVLTDTSVESYYYQNTHTNSAPNYHVEMISLNLSSQFYFEDESSFTFVNSKDEGIVSLLFSGVCNSLSIVISKDVLLPVVISLVTSDNQNLLVDTHPLPSPVNATSVSYTLPLTSGFSSIAILPFTTGSVTMGSDTISFNDFIPTNESLLSTVIGYNNLTEIAQEYNIPTSGVSLSIWVSPSNSERYILSIATRNERYVLAIPDASGDVTFQNLNYLGSYGSNKLPSLFSNGAITYFLTIIDNSNSLVGSGLGTTLTLSGNDLRLTFTSGGGIIFDTTDITQISNRSNGFVLSTGGSFTYSSISYTYGEVFITFTGELRITGNDGNIYRIYRENT